MQLFLLGFLVGRQAEDAVRIFPESLSLVKCQKFKEGTLVFLQFFAQIFLGHAFGQWLDAGVVFPYEALDPCRAVRQLGRCFRQDALRFRLMHVIRHSFAPLLWWLPLHK